MLRFRRTDRTDPDSDAVCTIAPGHTVERSVGWFRLGGRQYCFRCSCGWHPPGRSGETWGASGNLTNEAAETHARQLTVALEPR